MKLLKLLFVLVLLSTWSCSSDATDETTNEGTVTLEASGLSDNKLSINNTAVFTATLTGYDGNVANLSYQWTLDTNRGELSDGANALPNPTVADNTMRCVGKTSGDERIRVKVLDGNNAVIASAFMDFTITTFVNQPNDYGCFDQPKIIYERGSSAKYVCNFDGSNPEYLGVSSLSVAISPNGQWIAYNKFDGNTDQLIMYIRNCETGETITVPDGDGDDYTPEFSNDSSKLYFLRPEPSLEENSASGRPLDIAVYDMQTGETEFLTTIYQSDESVARFTVSEVTNEIAFIRKSYIQNSGIAPKLAILNPESGLITNVMTLSVVPNTSMDWSPNGEDIIFSSSSPTTGRGIFRMSLIDGIGPQLIFSDLSPQSLPPLFPHYYANGTRIAWTGQENGQNNFNIWTIDVNGNDLQQLTTDSANETVSGVLE